MLGMWRIGFDNHPSSSGYGYEPLFISFIATLQILVIHTRHGKNMWKMLGKPRDLGQGTESEESSTGAGSKINHDLPPWHRKWKKNRRLIREKIRVSTVSFVLFFCFLVLRLSHCCRQKRWWNQTSCLIWKRGGAKMLTLTSEVARSCLILLILRSATATNARFMYKYMRSEPLLRLDLHPPTP